MKYKIYLPEGYVQTALPGRDEWLSALRSGLYSQGNGCLSQIDHTNSNLACDCCLGVLCKVQDRPKVARSGRFEFDEISENLSHANPLYRWLKANGAFPGNVTVYAGEEVCQYLTECNDFGLTFTQIADIIETVWSNAPKNW